MRRSTCTAAAIAVFAASLVALAARQAPGLVPTLDVEASDELQGVATQIGRLDLTDVAEFARTIGLETAGPPVRVVLAGNASELGRSTPSWIAGFAVSRASTVVLFPGRTPSYPYDSISDVLRHELAHVLIARAAPGAEIPRWFHEGLAMMVERQWGLGDRMRVALAALGGPPRLDTLDAEFAAGDERAARAYALSGAFVRDLLARHGPSLPGRLLARLATGDPFDRAFLMTTGVPLVEAEQAWRSRWWYQVVPFLTSPHALWMGTALLAIAAIWRHMAARAARRRRWDEEERLTAEFATGTASFDREEPAAPEPTDPSETDATRSAPRAEVPP